MTAFWHMRRDNSRIDGYPEVPAVGAQALNEPVVDAAFAAADEYVLSNWPLAAAEHSGLAKEPLEVEVSLAKGLIENKLIAATKFAIAGFEHESALLLSPATDSRPARGADPAISAASPLEQLGF